MHFKFIFLFYLLINFDLKEDFFKKVLSVMLLIGLLQIPVTVIQVLLNKIGFAWNNLALVDIGGGTFGWGDTTGILAIYIGAVIYFLIAYQMQYRVSFKVSLLIILLFIPIFLSQSLTSFIIIPIGMILMLSKELKRNYLKVFGFSILTLLIVAIVMFSSGKLFDYRTVRNFDLEREIVNQSKVDSYGRPVEFGKIAAIIYANKLTSKNINTRIFGLGLGGTSQSYFAAFRGALADEFSGAGTVGYEMKPQIARILTEMGMLGLTFYFIFFPRPFIYSKFKIWTINIIESIRLFKLLKYFPVFPNHQ